jgi:hypothetical protein
MTKRARELGLLGDESPQHHQQCSPQSREHIAVVIGINRDYDRLSPAYPTPFRSRKLKPGFQEWPTIYHFFEAVRVRDLHRSDIDCCALTKSLIKWRGERVMVALCQRDSNVSQLRDALRVRAGGREPSVHTSQLEWCKVVRPRLFCPTRRKTHSARLVRYCLLIKWWWRQTRTRTGL